jgi:hypothetical protein
MNYKVQALLFFGILIVSLLQGEHLSSETLDTSDKYAVKLSMSGRCKKMFNTFEEECSYAAGNSCVGLGLKYNYADDDEYDKIPGVRNCLLKIKLTNTTNQKPGKNKLVYLTKMDYFGSISGIQRYKVLFKQRTNKRGVIRTRFQYRKQNYGYLVEVKAKNLEEDQNFGFSAIDY